MFYHLEGVISQYGPDYLVIDCGGVGYCVTITPATASSLKKGEKKKVFISEAIGENNFDLYGFLTEREKKYFELLITVSGIGPKAGMSILSYNSPDSINSAIVNSNEAAFTACPGIGKKTAQRIILELKDKIAKEYGDSSSAAADFMPAQSSVSGSKAYNDALSALSVLGYSQSDTIPVLKQIDCSSMTTEEIIRAVLKFMV